MKHLFVFAFGGLLTASACGDVLYSQPLYSPQTLIQSSWVFENGSDADMYVYDSFILPVAGAIERVEWQGGYIFNAQYGKAFNFSIYFYESTALNTEPHVNNPQLEEFYLARYLVGSNAGESLNANGLYDYSYNLPTSFIAEAGVKYWIRIEGFQPTYPDWGIARGIGPNHSHFRFSTGAAMFQFATGDTNFNLIGTPVPEPAAIGALAMGMVALLLRPRR